MEWFSQKTSIAGITISNWALGVMALPVLAKEDFLWTSNVRRHNQLPQVSDAFPNVL